MKAEILHMSDQEQSRAEIICLYIEGHIKQKTAAKRIELSTRQIRRQAKVPPTWGQSFDTRQPW